MAAKAEVLTGTAVVRRAKDEPTRRVARRVTSRFATWARRGQLGSTNYTDMGRYTGGRI